MLTVDVVSDVVCPFCLIGVKRLDLALARAGVPAVVKFHPFLLDPSTPSEGVDLRERLRKKFGGNPDTMFGRVEAMARESGIPLDFAKVRKTYDTVRAHTLMRHAKDQRALARELFDAYFLRGEDIGNVEHLAELATRHGFTREEAKALLESETEIETTRSEAAMAALEGVRGVPFFIFDDRLTISGAQSDEIFDQTIKKATEKSA